MNVGVIGGAGFLGLNIIKNLSKNSNYSIHGATRKIKPVCSDLEVKWSEISLQDVKSVSKYLESLDAVIYLVHEGGPNQIKSWIEESAQNLFPIQSFLEAVKECKKSTPLKVIYFSSGGAIYGRKEGPQVPWKESDLPLPISPYGVLKLTSEHYFRLATLQGVCECICLRVSNPYGNVFEHNKNQGIIDVAITKLKTDTPFTLFGEKSFVRDFIHLDDLNRAIEKCLLTSLPTSYEIINLGSGAGTTIGEALELVQKIFAKKIEIHSIQASAQVQPLDWCVLDISKAKKLLNWESQVNLEAGIRKSLV